MTQYQFTCPLQGCNNQIMTVEAQSPEDAVVKLVDQAQRHLAEIHPDVKKTNEEVTADISAHMVAA